MIVESIEDHPVQLPGSVRPLLDLGQHRCPRAVTGPADEPLVDRVSPPEPRRHVPPRRTHPVLPDHALDSEPVTRPRPTSALGGREQRLDRRPHRVRDLRTHGSTLAHDDLDPVDQHALRRRGLTARGTDLIRRPRERVRTRRTRSAQPASQKVLIRPAPPPRTSTLARAINIRTQVVCQHGHLSLTRRSCLLDQRGASKVAILISSHHR